MAIAPVRVSPRVRSLAIAYLFLQGTLTLLWWAMLAFWPASRRPFLPADAPDAMLLALFGSDLLLFAGGALLAAAGLARGKAWAWPVLLLHTGAVVYASLYSLGVLLLTGQGGLGAVLMAPPLLVTPYLAWRLRP